MPDSSGLCQYIVGRSIVGDYCDLIICGNPVSYSDGNQYCSKHTFFEKPTATLSPNSPQPPPCPVPASPAVWDLVIADMKERDRIGTAKYGQHLTAGDGRDSLIDAYQEILDAAVYLRKEIEERISGIHLGMEYQNGLWYIVVSVHVGNLRVPVIRELAPDSYDPSQGRFDHTIYSSQIADTIRTAK